MSWEILEGDARERLADLEDESVQACVTSPPYWNLRDYGVEDQIGLELTPEEYVEHLVDVFREVRRALRPDGTLWLNLGDSYASKARGSDKGWERSRLTNPGTAQKSQAASLRKTGERHRGKGAGLKNKDLVGIPWMVAFALRADGWWLRRDIIWHKPNPMPESTKDRPTSAHEYLFLLTKAERYFYDADAIREKDGGTDHPRHILHRPEPSGGLMSAHSGIRRAEGRNGAGRNKRSVWTIATRPFTEAHFAVFPPELVLPCVLAGTPPRSCGKCGAPRRRVVEREQVQRSDHDAGSKERGAYERRGGLTKPPNGSQVESRTLGWEATCEHDDDSGRAVVLDPFAGAGTTLLVAEQTARDSIGIEINPEYAEMARVRIRRWEADPNGHLEGDPAPLEGQGSLLEEEAA